MSLIYCYGVVEGTPKLEIKGFEEGAVCLIQFKELSAVVSDVSEENFSQQEIDKNIKEMKWLTEKAELHERVIEEAMKVTTIIPMKFCTIFKDEMKAEERLEEKYADFKFNLKELQDKVEIGVKVYFEPAQLKEELKEESPEIKELEEKAEEKTPGAAYFEKQKIDLLLKEKIRQKTSGTAKKIFELIKVLAAEAKQKELVDKKVSGKEMLLSAVFLIGKEAVENFKDKIEKTKADYPKLKFEVWGPFPPYNFVK